MKKYLLFLTFLLCVLFNTFQAYNAEECQNEIVLETVNSKNLLTYLEENNLNQKIARVCSSDICMPLNPANLKRDILTFTNKNLAYLKNKVSDETYQTLELKGFKIEKIILNEC